MKVELIREYRFEAAHYLPRVAPHHKCARLHGHSFRVEVVLYGAVDPESGWLVDFAVVDEVVEPIIAQIDHRCLNEIEGLDNPTSENLARWLWVAIQPRRPDLFAIVVWETGDSRCVYRGE